MPSESDSTQIKRLVEQAAELPASDRAEFLDKHCPSVLRDRVLSILSRLQDPTPQALQPAATVLQDIRGENEVLEEYETIGNYRIIKRLGEGGMAVVYLAEHMRLKHRVAIKVLPRLFVKSPDRVARFRAEAKVAANLKHRNIVAVHDIGESSDVEFLVMDYVEGPTLAQEIEFAILEHRDLSDRAYIDRQVRIVIGVADALHFAHGVGIVHRDVKPSNILVQNDEARLTDFGIAKFLNEPSTTATGHIIGSIAYMSPEQAIAASHETDPRSDIFSLGVVLYEMLSFVQPFRAATVEQSIRNVLEKTPDRLRRVNPAASVDLEVVCAKALEKKPAHRYQTAAHMAGDLRCFLEGRPILARRASLLRMAAVFASKYKTLLLAAAAIAMVAIIAGLISNELERGRAERCNLSVTMPTNAKSGRWCTNPGVVHAGCRYGVSPTL